MLGAEGLPDLTAQLKEYGIYGEYFEYRRKYLQWRRGGARGAAGEATVANFRQNQETEDDPYKFEFWYPTPSIFRWRFTASYWMSVTFLQGSVCVTFSSVIGLLDMPALEHLKFWPMTIGCGLFLIGCYIEYLQVINMPKQSAEQNSYLVADWSKVRERVGLESCAGAVTYFLGALVFTVGVIADFFPGKSEVVTYVFVWVPNTMGSTLFLCGGLCEILHNKIFRGGATWRELVWWASLCNTIGAILFLVGSAAPMCAPPGKGVDYVTNLTWCLGGFAFLVSSILMIFMWKVNHFGLTLLSQLNVAMRAGGVVSLVRGNLDGQTGLRVHLPSDAGGVPGEEKHKFSIRGVVFIMLYDWFVFVAMVNMIIMQIRYENMSDQNLFWHFSNMASQVIIVLSLTCVLIIHSAVTHVPNEQPYRFALFFARGICIVGATVQTAACVHFFEYNH